VDEEIAARFTDPGYHRSGIFNLDFSRFVARRDPDRQSIQIPWTLCVIKRNKQKLADSLPRKGQEVNRIDAQDRSCLASEPTTTLDVVRKITIHKSRAGRGEPPGGIAVKLANGQITLSICNACNIRRS